MSQASLDWASIILAAYGVNHIRDKTVVVDEGSFSNPAPYAWFIRSEEGEKWKKGEHGDTPGATVWLKQNFMSHDGHYDLKVVTGAELPRVKGNSRSATGKSDIVIGPAKAIHMGSTFDFALGLIELKTSQYPLKVGQNLLQLLSLSLISAFKKAVVLLATDCNEKWEIFYFSSPETITSKVYVHSSKAWGDLLQLLNSKDDRSKFVDKNQLWIPSLTQIPEQNLEGFDLSQREEKKSKAEEDEAMLEHFAARMTETYGERVNVPWWARANARIPDYYA